MIAPADRLLFWTAILGLPLATLAGVSRSARGPALGLLAIVAAAVVVDIFVSRRRLDGLTLGGGQVHRLRLGAEGALEVELSSSIPAPVSLSVALHLPAAVADTRDPGDGVIRLSMPAGPGTSTLSWPVRGVERGRHRLDSARLSIRSRYGFWDLRRRHRIDMEIRVYPDLLRERLAIATHFLRRGGIGTKTQRQIGKGREFEKLRDYLPGDSLDDIHWKASAKRGQLATKEFQIERTQEVYAVIDASRLSLRAAGGEPALERFLRAALVLALATRQYNDLFGLVVFADGVSTFLPARAGKTQFDACREALFNLRGRPVAPDFSELATFVRLRLRRRSLLVVLTDLDDPALADDFARSAQLLSGRHLVLASMLRPPFVAPIFSHPATTREEVIAALAGHLRWHRLRELARVLRRRGVELAVLDHETAVADVVSHYVAIKRRQVL